MAESGPIVSSSYDVTRLPLRIGLGKLAVTMVR